MTPTGSLSWTTAGKVAWRETRASLGKFAFVVLAVAVGVGALTGVRGFGEAFRRALNREARTIMAADLTVRVFALPLPPQQQVLDDLERRGVRRTWITETVSMVSSARQDTPLLVSIKAVEPALYPFYGTVKLEPAGLGMRDLDANSVYVSEDLRLRLNSQVGDKVRVGGQEFTLRGIVTGEPDRMSGSLNVGLRLMMSRDGLARTSLVRLGSRASQRYLFRMPSRDISVLPVKAELVRTFPEGQVLDYTQSHPILTRGLERATMFLSLVSLIALMVGALGVSMAMHSHIQQKMDTIAIMKSIGARSSQVVRIYAVQTLALGIAGGLLGVAVGAGVQRAFPLLLQRYFPNLPLQQAFDWASVGQGLTVGVLSTLLFTLPPLLGVRRVRPGLILRRDMPEARLSWWRRLLASRAAVVCFTAILLGMGAMAAWLGGSVKLGSYFAGGLVVSLLALAGVAWLLLRGLRLVLRGASLQLPPTLRHGMANLYRPGNQATAVLTALGVGVMFTLTVYLLQNSVLGQLIENAPPNMPNVFLLDITPEARPGVEALLRRQPGVQGEPDIVPSVAARPTHINGRPLEELGLENFGRRFLRTRSVTWSEKLPRSVSVAQGAWWTTEDLRQGRALVSVADEASRILRVRPGDTMDWEAMGQPFRVRVAATHRSEGFRMGAMSEFVFTPLPLQGYPVIYFGGVRVVPAQVGALQRVAYQMYPTMTVVNVAEALQIVQEVVDQIGLVIRFLTVFSMLAGVIILAASVAGTRFRRVREVVILKTLGGTRTRIAGIFSVEFLILGVVAGVMGSLLASGFANVVLVRLLDGEARLDWVPMLVCVAVTALLANAAGWAASHRILGQKPLEVLREE